MKRTLAAVGIVFVWLMSLNVGVLAQEDTSIFGTNSVSFVPLQVGGGLRGCTLVYEAVAADHVYSGGDPVVVVGNIAVHSQDMNVTLALKIGIRGLLSRDQRFQAPIFAYLQTDNSSTAKLRHVSADGDEGFRLFIVRLDDEATKLLAETIQAGRVTVGFNRKENGLDVLVPVDLTVVNSVVSGSRVVRTRSGDATKQFMKCVLDVVEGSGLASDHAHRVTSFR